MTARERYQLGRLRIANEIQCTYSSYTITQKGLKKRKLACNKSLSTNMSYLRINYVSAFATTEPDLTLLAVCTTVYTYEHSIMLCYV